MGTTGQFNPNDKVVPECCSLQDYKERIPGNFTEGIFQVLRAIWYCNCNDELPEAIWPMPRFNNSNLIYMYNFFLPINKGFNKNLQITIYEYVVCRIFPGLRIMDIIASCIMQSAEPLFWASLNTSRSLWDILSENFLYNATGSHRCLWVCLGSLDAHTIFVGTI